MFELKIYIKLLLINSKICLLFFAFSCLSISHAHEMWIQAVKYSVDVDEGILANEIVGQGFKGNKYAYIDTEFEHLNIFNGVENKAIDSRIGDLPAIQELTTREGLHIITAETTLDTLTYETAEKFNSFLEEDGLLWVLEEHKKRGLPDTGFKEVYRRYPKTLVKVGHGKGEDKSFAMPFEWVVETNPYNSDGNIKAQLLWQGKPAVGMHVNVFNKPKYNSSKEELIKIQLQTDDKGRVEIPRGNGGLFLVNSVKMIEPDNQLKKITGAVWESLWASLSYEILLAK